MPISEQPELLATYEGMRKSVFLGWDRPLCELAADYLAEGWTGGTLDLTGLLVLVATRQSGRKLRETLAAKISAGGGAVIPPIVTTPDALAAPNPTAQGEPDLAGAAELLKAWIDVLSTIDFHSISNLFPVDPPDREFNWALHTAADFVRLRKDLGENGLLITEAARVLAKANREPDRWTDLAKLERKVTARLRDAGLSDPQAARREAAERAEILPGTTRVILLGTPDPSPLAVRILEKYSRSIPVEVVVYAPDSERDTFDPWGRPEKVQWKHRPIDIPQSVQNISTAANPRAQASATADSLTRFPSPTGIAAVGIGDPEVVPHLCQTLGGIGIGTFDPSGVPASEHTVTCLLRHLRDLLETGSVAAFANLLKSADILDALRLDAGTANSAESECTFDPVGLLRKFDDLAARHLPDNLTDLAEVIANHPQGTEDIRFAIGRVRSWLEQFASKDFGATLPEFLGWAFSARAFRADLPDDAPTAEIARLVSDALDSMDGKIFSSRKKLGAKERLDLLLHLISSARIATERRPDDIELQGWLELLWEDAPHLILTGFNEGKIPESIVGDHYLPDAARNILGLRDNEDRLARDAYLLTSMIESRRDVGGVEFIIGATSQSGDPLRPSRLLFKCDRQDLPERAVRLFQTPDSEDEQIPARTFPWKLHPPAPSSPETLLKKIAVTGFADFLKCPFRFYLRHNLRMREIEVGKMEMNHADFGTVVHEVLRRFGDDAEMRDCDDPKTIREFLIGNANWVAARRFGRDLPVPILIQFESIKQRLGWVADEQAKLRSAGWRIEHVEWKFGNTDSPWAIDGFPVTGTIDRIDRHIPSGAVRILDYKTGKDIAPNKDHLGSPGTAELHKWEIADEAGKPRRWSKLQLPLYLLAARELLDLEPKTRVEVGYFHVPKSLTGCGIDLWENLDESILSSSMQCAQGVIRQINDQIYWPPRDVNLCYDDFAGILFGDPEEAVDAADFSGASL